MDLYVLTFSVLVETSVLFLLINKNKASISFIAYIQHRMRPGNYKSQVVFLL